MTSTLKVDEEAIKEPKNHKRNHHRANGIRTGRDCPFG